MLVEALKVALVGYYLTCLTRTLCRDLNGRLRIRHTRSARSLEKPRMLPCELKPISCNVCMAFWSVLPCYLLLTPREELTFGQFGLAVSLCLVILCLMKRAVR